MHVIELVRAYHPPTVPIRALPRDVIQQQRSRVLQSGEVEDYLRARITLNPSRGPVSVNAGIPKDWRCVSLTSARVARAGDRDHPHGGADHVDTRRAGRPGHAATTRGARPRRPSLRGQ